MTKQEFKICEAVALGLTHYYMGPKDKHEVIEFAIDNGLDPDDASTWAEQNLRERRGRDKDGNPINNWKGALTNYCKAMKTRRSA